MDKLEDFKSFPFSDGRWTRTVYRKGEGPPTILMHEMPGITPECADFARLIARAGFTVYMPSLFGAAGKEGSKTRFAWEYVKLFCVHREFNLFRANRASPITDWLRALARKAVEENRSRGVGAIGMCITGNFALTMALDRHMLAPVVAQPALPWSATGAKKAEVDVAPDTLAEVRRRHGEDGLVVKGYRFTTDTLCPRERFDTLCRHLGPAFDPHPVPDNGDTVQKPPHSIFTKELRDEAGHPTKEALNDVLSFLAARLR